jgi:hypothetical protein
MILADIPNEIILIISRPDIMNSLLRTCKRFHILLTGKQMERYIDSLQYKYNINGGICMAKHYYSHIYTYTSFSRIKCREYPYSNILFTWTASYTTHKSRILISKYRYAARIIVKWIPSNTVLRDQVDNIIDKYYTNIVEWISQLPQYSMKDNSPKCIKDIVQLAILDCK